MIPEGSRVAAALSGVRLIGVGRRGKFFWLELDRKPWVAAHFGMSGWYELSERDAPEPKYWKLSVVFEQGRLTLTDRRRLGRIWLIDDPMEDGRIARLGRDVFDHPPTPDELARILGRRKAPLKAILLDQGAFAGIGNYLADEILYRAKLNPSRLGQDLPPPEIAQLARSLREVTAEAVEAAARGEDPPEGWLFHVRWGRANRARMLDGREVVRDTIGGRTTAWVPEVQK